MINALRYEPRGQRQRFEPREQQGSDAGQRHMHLHLNVHVHLNQGARLRPTQSPTLARVTTIFAAFIGALSMALSLLVLANGSPLPPQAPLFGVAGLLILVGALLGSFAVLLGGLPLLNAVSRSTPRARFLVRFPLLAFCILLSFFTGPWSFPFLLIELLVFFWPPTWRRRFLFLAIPLCIVFPMLVSSVAQVWVGRPLFLLGLFALLLPFLRWLGNNAFFALLLYGFPLLCTVMLVRGVRRAEHVPDTTLRLATITSRLVVLGMVVMLVGVVLWGFALALFAPTWFFALISLLTYPWNSWLLIALLMLICVIVALWAVLRPSHASSPAAAHPHENAPSEAFTPYERGYTPVDEQHTE